MTTRAVLVTCLVACVAQSAPVRLVLSIGNDLGQLDDVPLRYAETDARRVKELFVELGAVRDDDAELLVGRSAADVEAALSRLATKVSALRAEQREVMVIVYVSSHAASGALHFGESELALSALRDAVTAIPASVRLLVVDACSSGAVVRAKGGRRAPPAVSLGSSVTRGTVVISSSGPAEAAQEWDSLTSSLFTHHWLAGLRGRADASRDGRVTLNEAYAYAYAETVAVASQHPSYEFELAGSGDLVLTEPRRASSAVDLAASLEGRFVVLGQDTSSVFLELQKSAGAPLRLALPPGRYLVRHTTAGATQLAEVSLLRESLTSLGDADFSTEPASAFARKGKAPRAWTFALELGLTSSPASTVTPMVGPGLWLRWQADVLWVSAGATFGAGALTGAAPESLVALQTAVGARVELGPLRFGFGLLARPMVLVSDKTRAALEMGAQGSLELKVFGPLFVGLSLEGLVRVLPVDPQLGTQLGWRGGMLLGSAF